MGGGRDDAARLAEAAGSSSYRGSPRIVDHGRAVIGWFDDGGGRSCLTRDRGWVAALHARIDAFRELGDWRDVSATDARTEVAERLVRLGPDVLRDVAGDFAIAAAHNDGSVVLARDAFGMRPLFWARSGRHLAFASDTDVLRALGFGQEYERDVIARYLAMTDFGGERTAFAGIRRLGGGDWISIDADGDMRAGRWFRPGDIRVRHDLTRGAAERRLRADLSASCLARARGRRACLLLSGGRDSGAIAVALGQSGIPATCLTSTFPGGSPYDEAVPAQQVAAYGGLRWKGVPAPRQITRDDLRGLPHISGTPAGLPAFPQQISLAEAARADGAEVVMDGEGGDALWHADPVACWELLRRGRVRTALTALTHYRAYGLRYDRHPNLLRSIARGATGSIPRPSLWRRWRSRHDAWPPWVTAEGRPDPPPAPAASSRSALVAALKDWEYFPSAELFERLMAINGAEYASPMLDLRVVELALALPPALRVPWPNPKPLLGGAYLGELDATREKADFIGYYESLGRAVMQDFPEMFSRNMRCVDAGLVRYPDGRDDQVWRLAALRMTNVETWLANRSGGT